MALAWLVVSLAGTAAQQDSDKRWQPSSWATWIFIGIIIALVLFSAAIG